MYHFNSFFVEYNNWPVPSSNECHLDEIKTSHNVQQLPAYNVRGNLIDPLHYEEKLAGSIAHVCFSIAHFFIKQKHVFNTYVKDITILRPPTIIVSTSLTHIYLFYFDSRDLHATSKPTAKTHGRHGLPDY
jgi:hypothetical protein